VRVYPCQCYLIPRLVHCCYTVVTLLLHCCYTVVTLLLHCCYTVHTLLHCCYTVCRVLPKVSRSTSRRLRPFSTAVVQQQCNDGVIAVQQSSNNNVNSSSLATTVLCQCNSSVTNNSVRTVCSGNSALQRCRGEIRVMCVCV
jgi:hypothetical protein